jgi:hypothetical protein
MSSESNGTSLHSNESSIYDINSIAITPCIMHSLTKRAMEVKGYVSKE